MTLCQHARPILHRRSPPRGRAGTAMALAVALALPLAGCGGGGKPEPEPVATVEVAVAARQVLRQTVTTEAVLYPLREAVLTPKITAPVQRFYVNRGDPVRAGELVAQLENADLAAAVLQSRGTLQQAQAEYESATHANLPEEMQKAQSDLADARQQLAAAQAVWQNSQDLYRQGAIPRRNLEDAHVAVVQAQSAAAVAAQHLQTLQQVGQAAAQQSAQGALTQAQGQDAAAQAALSYAEIHSPIDGVVTDRPVHPGELATTATPLMTIMDVSHVVARAHVPQADAALMRTGDAATITAGGQSLPARVTMVSPALDPGGTTVEVWIDAANADGRLRPGSTATAAVVVRTLPQALVVPSAALLSRADNSTAVMVVGADGKAHTRPVQVGIRQGDAAQILSGLEPGERVITAGAFGLDDGTSVRVAPPSGGDAGADGGRE